MPSLGDLCGNNFESLMFVNQVAIFASMLLSTTYCAQVLPAQGTEAEAKWRETKGRMRKRRIDAILREEEEPRVSGPAWGSKLVFLISGGFDLNYIVFVNMFWHLGHEI